MKDEEYIQNKATPPLPPSSHNPPSSSAAAAAVAPPLNTPSNTKSKKHVKEVPFNSDSILNGIGDYIFESPLGDGKFSKVMLAHHYSTGAKVAIKVINKRAHIYRVMSRLVREVALMEVLDHENIVQLYETYETADALYLVMEYVAGYNLEEYLKRIDKSIIPENQARDIFRQVVMAVDHCHSKWVVHRDLKTPNILLTADHQVKIADFGLGNRFGLTRLKTVCGSMLYYSPEIISARSYVGPEVDSWCLGIMLFRMTAGLELFSHAKTPSELKKFIINRHYKFPTHMSPELQTTIQKCLSIDRYDRLSLKTFLSQDPWFNNYGALDDVFKQRQFNSSYNAHDATESYAESAKSEDSNQIQFSAQNSKRQCKQDLQDERRRGRKVPKTVIYHLTNPATYFTGPIPHSSQNPVQLDAQNQVVMDLNQNLLVTLKQVRLQQIHNVSLTDLKSPISHLFRKFKRTESNNSFHQEQMMPTPNPQPRQLRKAASALNISQLYNRVTKDHISYFSIQCDIRSGSSTTVISGYSTSSTFTENKRVRQTKRLSHRLSMVFFSNTLPDLTIQSQQQQQQDTDLEQIKINQSEMIKIIRMVCEILGITYYQTSSSQLVCLLTLRNYKKPNITPQQPQQPQQPQPSTQHSLFRSKLFTSSDRLSDLHRKQSTSFISNSSNHSSVNNGWWSRQVHRISAPFNSSQSILLTGSSAMVMNSSHDLISMGRLTQQQQQQQQQQCNTQEETTTAADTAEDPDGFAMLSIDLFSVPSSKYNDDGNPLQIVATRFSKLKGSTKVFKLAKGWIQMLLSQNGSTSNKQKKFSRSDAEAYMKSAVEHFDENDVIRL
ncbi:CAMK/CAMKL/MARK protein kinase [Mucor circinelloides 1006PhL]|uniref:CAMK/CAMKL/MARK protein kinase n=1 Tax=Mucor circinelloides f. circinelloides (strain 1006PhL) TaxID=1220926 RepID=S2JUC9_MUCC1|nr:CAMK/CAMKL/MARK protein kinase [Mucor circinelloides 1006PhL]